MSDVETTFPVDTDSFVATLTKVLMEQSRRPEVAVLAFGRVQLVDSSYFDFGRDWPAWKMVIRLSADTYARIESDQRESVERRIEQVANEILAELEDRIQLVKVLPVFEKHPNWQHEAREFVTGKGGISNQGRVRSDNPAWLQHDGLFFRSKPEVNFYEACKAAGLVCAPLPVFLRPSKTPPFRIEPDMLILRERMVIQVEIDGSEWHKETPIDAQERVLRMEAEGVRVHRIRADACATVEGAKEQLRSMLNHFKLSAPR